MTRLNDLPVSFRSGDEGLARRRVALLEDSAEEALAVQEWLGYNGMDVHHRTRAEAFFDMLRRDSFDVLVLDWNVPDLTGYEVLRRVRHDLRLETPVLMLTARTGEVEVVQALNAGADDYLAKPWRSLELLARLRALMRGPRGPQGGTVAESIDGWTFDTVQCVARRGDVEVRLPRKEFEVARLLFHNLGRALSREHINQVVWSGGAHTRTVDTHVSRVRTGMGLTVANGYRLQAIYGFGYRLDRLEAQE